MWDWLSVHSWKAINSLIFKVYNYIRTIIIKYGSTYIGVGAAPAGQAMAWPLFSIQKENLPRIVQYKILTPVRANFKAMINSFNDF